MPNPDEGRDSYHPNLNELISLSKAAELCGLSPTHLRLLVGRGDIWGEGMGERVRGTG